MEWMEATETTAYAFDWAVFWAAVSASSAIATVLATLIALWVQHLRRPEPEWSITGDLVQDRSGDSGVIHRFIVGKLKNVGDGTAFSVHVLDGNLAEAWTDDLAPRMHVLAPGETLEFAGLTIQEDFFDSTIRVRWTTKPTRLNRRWESTIRLSEHFGMDGHVFVMRAPTQRSRPKRLRKGTRDPFPTPQSTGPTTSQKARPLRPPRWPQA